MVWITVFFKSLALALGLHMAFTLGCWVALSVFIGVGR